MSRQPVQSLRSLNPGVLFAVGCWWLRHCCSLSVSQWERNPCRGSFSALWQPFPPASHSEGAARILFALLLAVPPLEQVTNCHLFLLCFWSYSSLKIKANQLIKKCGIILPTVSLKTTTVVILCVSIAYFCHFVYLEGPHCKHHFEYAQFIMWSIPPHCCTLFLNQSPFLEGGIQSHWEVPSPPLNL